MLYVVRSDLWVRLVFQNETPLNGFGPFQLAGERQVCEILGAFAISTGLPRSALEDSQRVDLAVVFGQVLGATLSRSGAWVH